MSPFDFAHAFHALTGSPPFPWQTALYAEFASGRVPAAVCPLLATHHPLSATS